MADTPEANSMASISQSMHTPMRRSTDSPHHEVTFSEKMAGTFAEIYRGLYPYMTEKTRGLIKDFILKDPSTYEERSTNNRRAAATKLAKRIVGKHYTNIQRPGPLLPKEAFIGDVLEKELTADKARIAKALRPRGDEEDFVIDPDVEIKVLTKQLLAIPYTPSLLVAQDPEGDPVREVQLAQRRIINAYNNWVNTAAQVTTVGIAR